MTKREFKANVRHSIKESLAVLNEKMDHLLKSGAVDLETADLATCKAATRAFLLDEAGQFYPCGLDYSSCRKFDQEVQNMRYMM